MRQIVTPGSNPAKHNVPEIAPDATPIRRGRTLLSLKGTKPAINIGLGTTAQSPGVEGSGGGTMGLAGPPDLSQR
jgi:hypothetical protein